MEKTILGLEVEGGPNLKKGLRQFFGIGVRVLHANFGPKRFSRGLGIVTTDARTHARTNGHR